MKASRFALALLIFAFPVLAFAVPIAYVYTGVGSGSLNNVPFTSAAFTITAYGDTQNVVDPSYPSPGASYFNKPVQVVVVISGFPAAVANGPENFIQQLSNGTLHSNFSLLGYTPAFLLLYQQIAISYDLASPYGPFTVENFPRSPYPYIANDLQTTQGLLSLASDTANATFAGVLGATPPPVPVAPAAPIPLSPWWAIVGIMVAVLSRGRHGFT